MALGPLTLGSMYQWKATLTKNSAAWDVSALVCTFWWKRPNTTKFSQVGTTSPSPAGLVTYTDTATQLDAVGDWTVSVHVSTFGYVLAQEFRVVYSP